VLSNTNNTHSSEKQTTVREMNLKINITQQSKATKTKLNIQRRNIRNNMSLKFDGGNDSQPATTKQI